MGDDIQLGRIAGIRIGANWSLLIIFALIAWSLATGVLPAEVPRQPPITYWYAAVPVALVFYACLLAHELGHAIVARRRGVPVEGITLWLFGGTTRIAGEASSPGAEARISAVGPVISLVLGGLFALAGIGLDAIGVPALVVAAVLWLAITNAVLAVFNLLPAFPLDGGRLLRALVWGRTQDHLRATAIATGVGRLFAFLMIGLGLIQFFFGVTVSGLWLVFLGWFLLSAGRAEGSRVRLHDALAGVLVRDVMSRDPVVAPDWITVDEFIHSHALTHHFTTFPLRDFDGNLDGLITLADLKRLPPDRRPTTRVREVAHPLADVLTVSPTAPLADLLDRMGGAEERRALVMEDGKLVGIVSPTDITRALSLAALKSGRRA